VVCEIDDFDLASFSRTAAGFGLAHYGYVVTPNVDHLISYWTARRSTAFWTAGSWRLQCVS